MEGCSLSSLQRQIPCKPQAFPEPPQWKVAPSAPYKGKYLVSLRLSLNLLNGRLLPKLLWLDPAIIVKSSSEVVIQGGQQAICFFIILKGKLVSLGSISKWPSPIICRKSPYLPLRRRCPQPIQRIALQLQQGSSLPLCPAASSPEAPASLFPAPLFCCLLSGGSNFIQLQRAIFSTRRKEERT